MVALFSEAERATSSGIARLAPVVNKTGDFAKLGHGSAADWLGASLGTSTGVAKGRLVAAERAAATPEVAEAVREGDLSSAQLKLVTDATAVAPGSGADHAGPGCRASQPPRAQRRPGPPAGGGAFPRI